MAKFVNIVVGAALIALAFVPGMQILAPYLISAGIGMILTGVGTLLQKGPVGGVGTASRNPIAPWNVVYGRAKVAGTIVYLGEFDDENKYLDLVVVLACHPCDSVEALLIDSKRVALDSNGCSFTRDDEEVTLASIVRHFGVVTVTMVEPLSDIRSGDFVEIKDVPGDESLNGTYQITQLNATVFTYPNGGDEANVVSAGHARTTWPNYKAKIHMEVLLGDHTETFPGMIDGTPYDGDPGDPVMNDNNPWTAQHRLLGKTSAFLRLHYNDEIFAGGLPQIAFIIRGKKDIYDPRDDSTGYSTNAALCIADYLHTPIWGFSAVYDTEIPTDDLIIAANICDEDVQTAVSGTEKRYACNGGFPLTIQRGEALQNLLTSCAGRLRYSNGQWFIHPATWNGPGFTLDGPLARQFFGIDKVDFGDYSLKLSCQVDWSIGCWLKIPPDGHGTYVSNAAGGDFTLDGAATYILAISGGPATFDIEYSHDYADLGGVEGHEDMSFAANIPVNTWVYVGMSRDNTAKTVSIWVGDGTTVTLIGTQSYSQLPGFYNYGNTRFTLGAMNIVNEEATPDQWKNSVVILQSVYCWNGVVSEADHVLAMTGTPESAEPNLIMDLPSVGATPVHTDTAAGGEMTGEIWGTKVLGGPGSTETPDREIEPITLQDAAGGLTWRPKVSARELFNGVKGTFISATTWQASDFPPYAQDEKHGYASDLNLAVDGDRRWLDIQLPFTISVAAAQRLAKIELMRRRQQGTGTFIYNMAMYRTSALDIVAMTFPLFGWDGKLLEIAAHRFTIVKQQVDGDEVTLLGTEIDVHETAPEVYDWSITEELNEQGEQRAPMPSGQNTLDDLWTVNGT